MLTSLQNEHVKYVVSLHMRKARLESGAFVVEGWRFVEEAVRRKAPISKVFVCPEQELGERQTILKTLRQRNIPLEEVDQRVLRKMSATEEPQGILAVVRQRNFSWADVYIKQQTILLILDGIQDPGNMGTILRTALGLGVNYICTTPGTVDIYNPKVLRSTMGAIFSLVLLPDQRPEDILEFCRDRKIGVVVGDIQGTPIHRTEFSKSPLALVVGNEGQGPSASFQRADIQRVTIPMARNLESLNVAMAAGILLYEIARQRDFL